MTVAAKVVAQTTQGETPMTYTNRHASKTDEQLAWDLRWANREHSKHSRWAAIAEIWVHAEPRKETRLAVLDMADYHAKMAEYYQDDVHAVTAEQGRRELAASYLPPADEPNWDAEQGRRELDAAEDAAIAVADDMLEWRDDGPNWDAEDAGDNAAQTYLPRNTQRRHGEERRKPPTAKLHSTTRDLGC